MKITWFGTAALMLETPDAVLAFDPFDGIPLNEAHPEKGPLPHQKEFQRADHVFVTHGHFDHIIQIPAIFRGTGTVIHATETPRATLKKHGVPEKQLAAIEPDARIAFGGTEIHAIQGRHCRFDRALALRTLFGKRARKNPLHLCRLLYWNCTYREKGEILGYEVTSGSVRVMILGSLGLDPQVTYPQGADLLILPFQGKSDLTAASLPIVEKLPPKRIVLDHYDNSFPPMSDEIRTAEFEKTAENRYGIPCRALHKGEPLVIGES